MFGDDFTQLTLFITGPTWLRDPVRQACTLPEFGHRDAENAKRFEPALRNLRALANLDPDDKDWDVLIANGSGTTAMEACIRSLAAESETVLNVSVGAFGDLFHTLAQVNGKKAEQLRFESGETVDMALLEYALQEHSPAVMTCTHNETSTGVVNDIEEMCRLARRYGVLPVVDGVSIFGGGPANLAGVQPGAYATATQKALGLPAGFGVLFVHKSAEEKAQKVANRGYGSDILKLLSSARKQQTLTTPNCALANQLAVQLDYIVNEEGVHNRFDRHERLRSLTAEWVGQQKGLELLAPANHRSPTLTAVKAPEGTTVQQLKDLKERMRARGYLFDPGYGKLNAGLEAEHKPVCFRIGHMGDVTEEMLSEYLQQLEEELKSL